MRNRASLAWLNMVASFAETASADAAHPLFNDLHCDCHCDFAFIPFPPSQDSTVKFSSGFLKSGQASALIHESLCRADYIHQLRMEALNQRERMSQRYRKLTLLTVNALVVVRFTAEPDFSPLLLSFLTSGASGVWF